MNEDETLLLQKEEEPKKVWKNSKIGLYQYWIIVGISIFSYLQIYALIASLALTWTFPENYITNTHFVFLFNLDIWEFSKVSSGYTAQSKTPILSRDIMNDKFFAWYSTFIIIHWGLMTLFCVTIYLGNRNAKLKNKFIPGLRMVGMIIWYIFLIPVGVNYSKAFWCLPWTGKLDVSNDLVCGKSPGAKVSMFISIVSIFVHFIVIPIHITSRIKQNVVTPFVRAHEGYLLRREIELDFSINKKYFTEKNYLFSPFRRRQCYFIVIEAALRLCLVIFYCAFFSISNDPQEKYFFGSQGKLISASGIFFILFSKLLYDFFRWPFRPFILNVLHWLNLIYLSAISAIGVLLNVPDLENSMLTPNYLQPELIAINVSWLILAACWVTYSIFKSTRRRIWPSLYSKTNKPYLVGNNDRFIDALEEASKILLESQKSVPLFAPAHKIKLQILKINALTREAEYNFELLHPTLQECLQMLIEIYAEVSKISIFSTIASNMKKAKVAEELMELIPDFSNSLHQRDFDLALSRKSCRSALLKISAVAAFREAGARRSFNSLTSSLNNFS